MKVCSNCGNCFECHESNDIIDCFPNDSYNVSDAYDIMMELANQSNTCAWNGHKEDGFGK